MFFISHSRLKWIYNREIWAPLLYDVNNETSTIQYKNHWRHADINDFYLTACTSVCLSKSIYPTYFSRLLSTWSTYYYVLLVIDMFNIPSFFDCCCHKNKTTRGKCLELPIWKPIETNCNNWIPLRFWAERVILAGYYHHQTSHLSYFL